MKKFAAAAVLVLCSLVTTAAELKEIVLPKPDLNVNVCGIIRK